MRYKAYFHFGVVQIYDMDDKEKQFCLLGVSYGIFCIWELYNEVERIGKW